MLCIEVNGATVGDRPGGRLRALGVSLCKSVLCGASVWAFTAKNGGFRPGQSIRSVAAGSDHCITVTTEDEAGLDEGLLQFSLYNLVCMENPYKRNTCQ